MLVGGVEKIAEVLPDCVRSALVPALSRGGLLRGEDFHKGVGKDVELVGGLDVAVEGDAVELGEHVNAPEAAVDAVAYGDVHDAALATERHRGLGPFLGEREKAATGSPSHDDREGFVTDGGPVLEAHGAGGWEVG